MEIDWIQIPIIISRHFGLCPKTNNTVATLSLFLPKQRRSNTTATSASLTKLKMNMFWWRVRVYGYAYTRYIGTCKNYIHNPPIYL
jgi:hypothetical protein